MLSIGAVPKPELSHQAQAELKIPEHRADVAIIPLYRRDSLRNFIEFVS